MGKQELSEEKVEQIRDTYSETRSLQKTAEKEQVDKSTVSRHTRDMRDTSDSDDSDSGGKSAVIPPSDGENEFNAAELRRMGPGEFVESILTHIGGGLKDDFIGLLASQAELRQSIPDESQLNERILQASSGIANTSVAGMIAEVYWDVANRWLTVNGQGISRDTQMTRENSSEWVNTPRRPQQPPARGGQEDSDDGEWVSPQPDQPRMQRGGTSQSPPQNGPPPRNQHPPRQTPPRQRGLPGQSQNPQMVEMMQMMMERQQETLDRLLEEQQSSDDSSRSDIERLEDRIEELAEQATSSDTEDKDPVEQLVELSEKKEQLESVLGTDEAESSDVDDLATTINQQMAALRQELIEDRGDSNVDGIVAQLADAGRPEQAVLYRLLETTDADPSEISDIADNLGVSESDPEMVKARAEAETEKRRLQQRKETLDGILEAADRAAETIADSEILTGGSNGHDEGTVEGGGTKLETVEERDPDESRHADANTPDQPSPTEQRVRDLTSAEPEPEPETDDGSSTVTDDSADTEDYACEGCGKEYSSHEQLRGHLAHCDEYEPQQSGEDTDDE